MLHTAGHPSNELVPTLLNLLGKSLADSSWASYQRSLGLFVTFLQSYHLPLGLPVHPTTIALYISYLHDKNYAHTSIRTLLSAIAYIHEVTHNHNPCDSWLVDKILAGAKRDKPRCDVRMPITRPLLAQLAQAANSCITKGYERLMFVSMLFLAFAAFLRVGEMSLSQGNRDNILTLGNVHLSQVGAVKQLTVIFTSYKHSAGRAAQVQISERATIEALERYLAIRGPSPGFLFVWPSGKPVSREQFNTCFQRCLSFCGLDASLYKTHKWIGAACQAAADGYTVSQIKAWGRWHSDAFQKYLRFY